MFLVFSLYTLSEGSLCVEICLRHPKCVWTSQGSPVFCIRAGKRMKPSTYKAFSKSIGAPPCVNSLYRVSLDDLPVRSCLTEKDRGRCHWKESGVPGIAILCERYCSSLYYNPSQPATNLHTGGIFTLVDPRA